MKKPKQKNKNESSKNYVIFQLGSYPCLGATAVASRPMITITTISSAIVKPAFWWVRVFIIGSVWMLAWNGMCLLGLFGSELRIRAGRYAG